MRQLRWGLIFNLLFLLAWGVSIGQAETKEEDKHMETKIETATLAAGCFWCVEAVFDSLKGVTHVESGYSGGNIKNPTYEQVSTGKSGHAEAIRLEFDPKVITFEEILEVFFHAHDPTTLNRQGADAGPQYRSAIFYHSQAQKESAEKVKSAVQASGLWPDPIVTEITPFSEFYPAEDYHQNFYRSNPQHRYCSIVIAPKLKKLHKEYANKFKGQ